MVVYRSIEISLRISSSSCTAATLLRISVVPVSASSSNKSCNLFTRLFNFRCRNLSPSPTLVFLMTSATREEYKSPFSSALVGSKCLSPERSSSRGNF